MEVKNPHDNIFYLGFNKDTGELVDVLSPANKKTTFHPEDFKKLHKKNLSTTMRAKLKKSLEILRQEIRDSSIPPKRLVFVDEPGKSICAGSCGGIPFRIC